MFQVWSPAGSQAIDQGPHTPRASSVGAQSTDWGAYQPGSLGVCTWAACLLIRLRTYSGSLGLCALAARSLIRVRTDPGFQVWASRLLIEVRTDLGFRCVLGLLIW